MRSMCRARRVVQEPRLSRSERVLHAHPRDRLVRQIAVENVVGVAEIGLDWFCVLVEGRMPLIGITPEKSVEVLKTETTRPQIKRPRLAGHPVRDVVHLAKPGRVIAVLPESFSDRTGTLGDERVVTREPSGELRNHSACRRVMIA